jgi:very-short-patch-repair endonuclease
MSNLGEGIDPNWEPASDLEAQFAMFWVASYPELDLYTEHQFSKRKFRFDFCCPVSKVAIEIQGGTWIEGGHSTGKGINKDYEKLNLAQMLGWQVFQLTADTCLDNETLRCIAKVIRDRTPKPKETAA